MNEDIASNDYRNLLDLTSKDVGNKLCDYPSIENPGISGNAGVALYLAYQYLHSGDEKFAAQSSRSIELAVHNMDKLKDNSIGGFAGIAWTVQHLINIGILNDDFDDNFKLIDDLLEKSIRIDIENRDYDLFYGIIGRGIYFLERFEQTNSKVILAKIVKVVQALNLIAERSSSGISWKYLRDDEVGSAYSLGLAHGISSIISFFSKLIKLDLKIHNIKELELGAIDWLLNKKYADRQYSFESDFYTNSQDENSPRLAWCNGDLGISIALLSASQALGNCSLYNESIDIAMKTCNRNLADSGVFIEDRFVDPNFCHGISGIAHIYGRLFKATNKDIFLERHRYWLMELIKARRDGYGIAGFISDIWLRFDPIKRQAVKKWDKDPGLLIGTSGVGLVLLSALHQDYKWDKIFLTDL
jgi:lantibiotic modifying enzyme